VIFGIEKPASKTLSTMSACPGSYGVSVSVPFSEIRDHDQDRVVHSLSRIPMAKDQPMWLIKKGDLILSTESKVATKHFTVNLPETGPGAIAIPIFAYYDDDIPERFCNSRNGGLMSFGYCYIL
jgi:hypothetical protein